MQHREPPNNAANSQASDWLTGTVLGYEANGIFFAWFSCLTSQVSSEGHGDRLCYIYHQTDRGL